VLQIASPSEGQTLTSASITVGGTVSDAISGLSSLQCNGVSTSPGGSFSCADSLDPGVNLILMRATDVAGNIALTKLHVNADLPLPSPTSIRITPGDVNLVIGATQQFSAIDEQGRPRTDATWSLANSNLGGLSSDSSPVLTALSAGLTTLTATIGGVSSHIQVVVSETLVSGTSQWTAPLLPGAFAFDMHPAIPSGPGTPSVYSLQQLGNGIVIVGLTSDGRQLWQQQQPQVGVSVIPDLSGGVITAAQTVPGQAGFTLNEFDDQTGKPVWQYVTGSSITSLALRPDGALLAIERSGRTDEFVDIFSGATGQLLGQIPLKQNTDEIKNQPCNDPLQSETDVSPVLTNSLTVDASGAAFLEYTVQTAKENTVSVCDAEGVATSDKTVTINYKTFLMTIYADGSTSEQLLKEDTGTGAGHSVSLGATVFASSSESGGTQNFRDLSIPDGQGGALASWIETPYGVDNAPLTTMVSHQSPGGSGTYPLSVYLPSAFVLGDDGTAFALATKDVTGAQQSVVAFDMNSGQPLWTYQSQDPSHRTLNLAAATDDGGILVAEQRLDGNFQDTGTMDMVHVDTQGTPSTVATLGTFDTPVYSWGGQWYAVSTIGSAVSIPIGISRTSLWANPNGSPSKDSRAARQWFFVLTFQNQFTFTPDVPSELPALTVDLTNTESETRIKAAAVQAIKDAYSTWPVTVVEGDANTGDARATVVQTEPQGTFLTCGVTPNDGQHESTVYYKTIMEEAQNALQAVINNQADENKALNNLSLITAIGRGIGTNSAHELAHQFLALCCEMDADPVQDPNAKGTYNEGNSCDGDPNPDNSTSDPAFWTGFWKDGKTPIHWEDQTGKGLQTCLTPGWHSRGTCNKSPN